MMEGRIKKLLKMEAKTMLKDRQLAGGILDFVLTRSNRLVPVASPSLRTH